MNKILAYIKAMENPYTDIMVHPGRPDFEMDLERIAHASALLSIPVEINNSSLSTLSEKDEARKNCCSIARYMVKYKGPVILGSDAHFWDRVGEFREAVELIGEVGISQHQILNTSPERVLDYLASRRKHRTELNQLSLKQKLSIA